MSLALHRLPAAQLAPLEAAYARAGRRRAVLALLGVALVLAGLLLATWFIDARPALLWERRAQLLDYFSRLLTLTEGDLAGGWVWQDPAEWFWGWERWLGQLLERYAAAWTCSRLLEAPTSSWCTSDGAKHSGSDCSA